MAASDQNGIISYTTQRLAVGASNVTVGSLGATCLGATFAQVSTFLQLVSGGTVELLSCVPGATTGQLGTGFPLSSGLIYNLGTFHGPLYLGNASGTTGVVAIFTGFNR